jgi:hypothetical protein
MNAQSSDNNVNPTSYQQLMIRYERLMDITCQLNSTLDLDALLKRIVTAASELTETEQASILLVDPDTGELRFEAASNLSRAEMEAIPVPLRGSLAGWVVTHGEPVLVEDARSDSRWFARVDKTIKFTRRSTSATTSHGPRTMSIRCRRWRIRPPRRSRMRACSSRATLSPRSSTSCARRWRRLKPAPRFSSALPCRKACARRSC